MKQLVLLPLLVLTLVFTIYNSAVAQTDFWEPTSGPSGGEIRSVVFTPSGVTLAATSYSGIFRSTDDGKSWKWSSRGLPVVSGKTFLEDITGMAVSSDTAIFAGTDIGLFRSTDLGTSWSAVARFTDSSITYLSADPGGDLHLATYGGSIYRSTDAGGSWSQSTIAILSDGGRVQTMALTQAGTILLGTDSHGIFRSTDNGTTWSDPLRERRISDIESYGAERLLATVDDSLYRSTDDGQTWFSIVTDLPVNKTGIGDITIFNTGTTILIAAIVGELSGSRSVALSQDSGASWRYYNHVLYDSSNLRLVAYNPDGQLFAGTEHGLFRSDIDGKWSITGVPATTVRTVATPGGGSLFASTYWEFSYGFLWRSTDGGMRWELTNRGLDGKLVMVIEAGAVGGLVAGTSRGIMGSTDDGTSWSPLSSESQPVYSLLKDQNMMYAGTVGGVYRSTDGGVQWMLKNNAPAGISFLALCGDSSGNLLAGTSKGLFHSTNQGESWVAQDDKLSNHVIATLLAGSDGTLFASTRDAIFRSTDGGTHWDSLTVAPDQKQLLAMTISPEGHLYVSFALAGVYRSTDRGETWTPIGNSTGIMPVSAYVVAPDKHLYAGTYGLGVVRSVEKIVLDIPTNLSHEHISMIIQLDPIVWTATIVIHMPQTGQVRLSLYSLQGEEIRRLHDGELTSGNVFLPLDITGLASGTYIVRIEAGSESISRQVVIVK